MPKAKTVGVELCLGTYSVTNLGTCGTTLSKTGASPYWNSATFVPDASHATRCTAAIAAADQLRLRLGCNTLVVGLTSSCMHACIACMRLL